MYSLIYEKNLNSIKFLNVSLFFMLRFDFCRNSYLWLYLYVCIYTFIIISKNWNLKFISFNDNMLFLIKYSVYIIEHKFKIYYIPAIMLQLWTKPKLVNVQIFRIIAESPTY